MNLKYRQRRLRGSENLRRLVRETTLDVSDFIFPLFVRHGVKLKEEIPSMPGQFRFSPDNLEEEIADIASLKIPAVLLFGLANIKDDNASEALKADGAVQQAVKSIKKIAPGLVVITDVCVCGY